MVIPILQIRETGISRCYITEDIGRASIKYQTPKATTEVDCLKSGP